MHIPGSCFEYSSVLPGSPFHSTWKLSDWEAYPLVQNLTTQPQTKVIQLMLGSSWYMQHNLTVNDNSQAV
jgi:hypothetical protein